jgi:hypothetical protein
MLNIHFIEDTISLQHYSIINSVIPVNLCLVLTKSVKINIVFCSLQIYSSQLVIVRES